jgi:hypothetical protein
MSARVPKIDGPPPETQNNRSVGSAAVVQSSLDAGQCEQAHSTNQTTKEAAIVALRVGEHGKLDKASLKIVEKALVEQIAPIALSLAALAKDQRGLNRVANAFRLEICGGLIAAMKRIRDGATAQRSLRIDQSKARVLRNGSLSRETNGMVEDAIFAALAPLVTSREVRWAIYPGSDDAIIADLIWAIRETVWTERFDALQAGEHANG